MTGAYEDRSVPMTARAEISKRMMNDVAPTGAVSPPRAIDRLPASSAQMVQLMGGCDGGEDGYREKGEDESQGEQASANGRHGVACIAIRCYISPCRGAQLISHLPSLPLIWAYFIWRIVVLRS